MVSFLEGRRAARPRLGDECRAQAEARSNLWARRRDQAETHQMKADQMDARAARGG